MSQIRWRWAVVAAVAAVVGATAWAAHNHLVFRDAVIAANGDQLLLILRSAAREIEAFSVEHRAALESVDSQRRCSPGGSCALAELHRAHRGHVLAVAVLDDAGNVEHSHPQQLSPELQAGLRQWAEDGGGTYQWFTAEPEPRPLMVIGRSPGDGLAHLAMVVDVESLYHRYIESIDLGRPTCSWLIDERGTVLGSHDNGRLGSNLTVAKQERFPDSDLSDFVALVSSAAAGDRGVGTFACPEHGLRLAAYGPVAMGAVRWSVGLATGYEDIAGPVHRHAFDTAVWIGFVLLVSSGLGLSVRRLARKRDVIAKEAELLRRLATVSDELRESEERYRTVVESSNDGMALLRDGHCLYANPTFVELTGGLGTGGSLPTFLHPADRERVSRIHHDLERRGGSPCRYECRGVSQHGTVLTFEVSAAPVPFEGGVVSLACVRDATERRRVERHEQVEDRLKSVANLAAGIAHDFNNVLTSVVGNISLALSSAQLGELATRLLGDAQAAADRARELSDKLMGLASEGEFVLRSVVVQDLVQDVIDSALGDAPVRCELALDLEDGLVAADATQLARALHAVVVNALEASPEEGVITVVVEQAGGEVVITVRDEGPGLSAEVLEHAFDPYFTTKPRGVRKGTGLGLSLARAVVEKHGGQIDIESAPGAGTSVRVSLPAAEAEAEKPEPAPPVRSSRVLVMDDEDMIRVVAEAMLGLLGHDCEVATTGEEAVEYYQAALKAGRPFDLVILDLTVAGGAGGKVALGRLLEIDPEVRAVVSSGYSADPAMEAFREHGFCGVLRKPYGLRELGDLLSRVL